jgi:RHS repeat-associated protein
VSTALDHVTARLSTLTYTANGLVQALTDGEDNRTSYVYDGFDRLSQTQYPSPAKGSGTSNPADFEQLTYDADSDVTQRRVRSGAVIGYSYDNLDRMTHKGGPLADRDYTYDNLGRMLSAKFSTGGQGVTDTYDALSRLTSSSSDMGGTARAMSYEYDPAGQRTKLTYPDGYYLNYDHLVTGEVSAVRENGATSGIGVLATYAFDNLGNRASVTFSNGTKRTYGYDPVSRLTTLTNDLAGTANDLTHTLGYNPGSQITSLARSNDAYAFPTSQIGNVNRPYSSNGLNQYMTAGPASFTYDANGNLTSDGTNTFGYDIENELTSATEGGVTASLSYDPLGRLWDVAKGSSDARFFYDGSDMIVHYDSAGTVQYRYVFGPGTDEPFVQYNPSGVRTWYAADERGSIIGDINDSGSLLLANTYDEYGIPGSANTGRFQYTGQMWLPELGMYYYKARIYSPTLGRFLQTDPIGAVDSPNLYQYVLNDSVNLVDPLGLHGCDGTEPGIDCRYIPVTGHRVRNQPCPASQGSASCSGGPPPGPSTGRGPGTGNIGQIKITINKNCQGVGVLNDPKVQSAMRNALAKSLSGNDSGTAEFGFFVGDAMFGSNWIGPTFTSGFQSIMDGDQIKSYRPLGIANLLTGYWPRSVFIHTHPNNTPPSPVDDKDIQAAEQQGMVIVAIDKGGNVTCGNTN